MTRVLPRVYILNNGGHDYSHAERFGELIICTEGSIRKDDIAQMYRVLSTELADMRPEDYILVTSLTSLCMVAAAIMAARFGVLNVLIYKDGNYVAKTLDLECPL